MATSLSRPLRALLGRADGDALPLPGARHRAFSELLHGGVLTDRPALVTGGDTLDRAGVLGAAARQAAAAGRPVAVLHTCRELPALLAPFGAVCLGLAGYDPLAGCAPREAALLLSRAAPDIPPDALALPLEDIFNALAARGELPTLDGLLARTAAGWELFMAESSGGDVGSHFDSAALRRLAYFLFALEAFGPRRPPGTPLTDVRPGQIFCLAPGSDPFAWALAESEVILLRRQQPELCLVLEEPPLPLPEPLSRALFAPALPFLLGGADLPAQLGAQWPAILGMAKALVAFRQENGPSAEALADRFDKCDRTCIETSESSTYSRFDLFSASETSGVTGRIRREHVLPSGLFSTLAPHTAVVQVQGEGYCLCRLKPPTPTVHKEVFP